MPPKFLAEKKGRVEDDRGLGGGRLEDGGRVNCSTPPHNVFLEIKIILAEPLEGNPALKRDAEGLVLLILV